MGSMDGKVALVTGGGRGVGRGVALEMAAAGASVVVNDLGGSLSGHGDDASPAQQVVDEIVAAGGRAVADTHSVADWDGAEANTAKFLGARAGYESCLQAVLTHGGFGYAKEYHVERLLREVTITRIAPVTEQLILSFIAEKVLELPKSY